MKKQLMLIILAACLLLVTGLQSDTGQDMVSEYSTVPVPHQGKAKDLYLGKPSIERAIQSQQTVSTATETHFIGEDIPFPLPAIVTNRQGGEDISTATAIPELIGTPYTDTGHTTGYNNDYDEDCPNGVATGMPDVVYSYTPGLDEYVDISLCNSSYATNMWIYRTNQDTIVACERWSPACSEPRSELLDVEMYAGMTYFIVIDGDWQITGYGDYEINCSATEIPQLSDSSFLHPAFADAGNGNLILGYQSNVFDTALMWWGSDDDGASFPTGGSFGTTNQHSYPSVAYWGRDTLFHGTQVGSPAEGNDGDPYVIDIPHPIIITGWNSRSWGFGGIGWHDMRMADIACDTSRAFVQKPGEKAFGVVSMVHSSTFTTPDLVDAPHLLYEKDTAVGVASISWYTGLDNCLSTMVDIDPVTTYSYAIYDPYDSDASQRILFIRYDLFSNMETGDAGGYTYSLDPGEHVQYPAVAAYNGNIVIITEFYTDATPEDRDIICWYASGSAVDALATSVVIGTTDDERFPRVAHVTGNTYACTYIANNALYLVTSTDAGATWGTPEIVSGDDLVVSEYRASDITERGSKVVWEYQPLLPDDSSIFIHFASTDLIVDSDSDGIPDDEDNCPSIANPLQEDADGDLVGDVCDECTDTDGDGYGNPGYAANTCEEDNCPDIANQGQEDADADLVGDACDECTDTDGDGYGNPGYAANTCEDDNCPDVSNPGQEDTNSDGIGDACCCALRGDVDGNGQANISDVTYLVDYLFAGGPGSPCPEEGDADGGGGSTPMNISDLTYMVEWLFGGGSPPPPCD